MIRISKLADYGTVIMACLASTPGASHTAKEIAVFTHLSVPTVSKLLKQLARAELLLSQRGSKGGYALSRNAKEVTLAEIIHALDGQVALTECSQHKGICAVEKNCAIRRSWRNISSVVSDILSKITLAEMLQGKA